FQELDSQSVIRRISTHLRPKEVVIDLSGAYEVLELLKPREGSKGKCFGRHVDSPEKLVKLLSALASIPGAFKAGKLRVDFFEGDAIAAIVGSGRTKAENTAGKNIRNDLGDFL